MHPGDRRGRTAPRLRRQRPAGRDDGVRSLHLCQSLRGPARPACRRVHDDGQRLESGWRHDRCGHRGRCGHRSPSRRTRRRQDAGRNADAPSARRGRGCRRPHGAWRHRQARRWARVEAGHRPARHGRRLESRDRHRQQPGRQAGLVGGYQQLPDRHPARRPVGGRRGGGPLRPGRSSGGRDRGSAPRDQGMRRSAAGRTRLAGKRRADAGHAALACRGQPHQGVRGFPA
jgi:hypothetical protein